ncbi:MAG: Clp protease ClpP [Clostridium perfringens]|uniref:head maturation protease, ClpP-related n=1 Tax=Clostridium perfringens TaxID=1502 RepID=UPI00244CECC9|nr:head maturation protease, ClpP-related [Clostridium perfringens]MDH2474260.1 Clp protease ClpP [Clostridium perfringens]MDU7067604.1 Clp protease ClpP [Clostridium perfringens]
MVIIEIKGDIIEDDSQWIYDWIGWSYTSPKNVINKLKEANGQPVTLKINSPGGSVFAASEIYTELRNYTGDVNIQIVGLAASAASVIAMAGRSSMSPTAQLMVHNVSTRAGGDYRVMEHTAEILKNANDTIANAYIAKSGMTREEALELMDKESYLSAQKAKELGLIDEIMFDNMQSRLTNNVNLGLYNSLSSIPEEILNLINKSSNQPIIKESNMVDIFMQQKAQSELDILKLGGIK